MHVHDSLVTTLEVLALCAWPGKQCSTCTCAIRRLKLRAHWCKGLLAGLLCARSMKGCSGDACRHFGSSGIVIAQLPLQGSSGGSLGGSIDIANRGQIRFYRQSATTCTVKLTISYEVPDVLAPFAGALTPIVESILSTDLKRFANLAAQEPLSA